MATILTTITLVTRPRHLQVLGQSDTPLILCHLPGRLSDPQTFHYALNVMSRALAPQPELRVVVIVSPITDLWVGLFRCPQDQPGQLITLPDNEKNILVDQVRSLLHTIPVSEWTLFGCKIKNLGVESKIGPDELILSVDVTDMEAAMARHTPPQPVQPLIEDLLQQAIR